MVSVRVIGVLLGTAGSLLACNVRNEMRDPARSVVASVPSAFCSVQVSTSVQREASLDSRRARLLDLADAVAANLPNVHVTYLDFSDARSLTLSVPLSCAAGASFAEIGNLARRRGFDVSEPFQPNVIVPREADASAYFEQVLQQTSEAPATLEGCSISVPLSPSSSAGEERDFYAAIGLARDRYGLPLLFMAQADHTMYVTLYRQCSKHRELYRTLEAVLERHYRGTVRMNGYAPVERSALRRAYALEY